MIDLDLKNLYVPPLYPRLGRVLKIIGSIIFVGIVLSYVFAACILVSL